MQYDVVIGLEVHAELKTQTKCFLFLQKHLWRFAKQQLLSGVHGIARRAARAEQICSGANG